MRYHWIRKVVNNQEILLKNIHTDKNLANMLTKVVTRDKYQSLKNSLSRWIYSRSSISSNNHSSTTLIILL